MKKKILIAVISVVLILFIASLSFFRAIVPSKSMENTICEGTQLIILKDGFCSINRGDIITFERDDTLYLKRVIGMPNDWVYIENGSVYINGCLLSENYVSNKDLYCGQFRVPENSYFVMGDNRINSNDSRYWSNPYVEFETVCGKAVLVIYPNVKKVEREFYEIF